MANDKEGDEELALKRDELALKRNEFDFRKQEARTLESVEKRKVWVNIGSVLVAALALAIPVWIAAITLRAQQRVAEEQARLTFQMKVADLAFTNVRNATAARERALSLAALFRPSELLPNTFAKDFDPKLFKVNAGHSIENRQKLVTLLAQYPKQRKQILSDWYVLFQWEQWWVEPLLEVSEDEKRELDEMSQQLVENEQRLAN